MPNNNLSLKFYEGKPCRKCGLTRKYVSNSSCVDCASEYGRKWKRANLERERERRRKRQANPKKQREYCRKWREANPKKDRECSRKWRKANPKKFQESHQTSQIKTRAKRKQAEGSHTTQEWITLKEKYNNCCLCCGIHESECPINSQSGRPFVLEQDHIIPLSPKYGRGTNWISNIQPLCHTCHGFKGTTTHDFKKAPHPFCVI